MYEKSNSFVSIFAIECQFFPNNFIRDENWKLACSITWTIFFETPFLDYLSMCPWAITIKAIKIFSTSILLVLGFKGVTKSGFLLIQALISNTSSKATTHSLKISNDLPHIEESISTDGKKPAPKVGPCGYLTAMVQS